MGTIRFILACAVVIVHSGPVLGLKLTDGRTAVQGFYLLSGFCIAMVLRQKYTGPGSYRLFVKNRALRLFPLYWVVVIIGIVASLATGVLLGEWGRLAAWKDWFGVLDATTLTYLVTVNALLLGSETTLFMGLNVDVGSLFFASNFRDFEPELRSFLIVPPAWTLSVFFWFYLVAPPSRDSSGMGAGSGAAIESGLSNRT